MKRLLASVLALALLFTGCSEKEDGSSTKDENSSAVSTTSSAQSVVDTPTEPEAISLDAYLVDNEEGIYNLSELDAMKDIDVKNAVMAGENTIYFLSGDKAEMLMGLDLLTGSVYDIATVDINADEVFYAASIINLDPIIIYYSFEEGAKYFLIDDKRNVKDTTDIFTDNMSVSSYKFTEDGKLYFYNELSSKLMNVDLESFELEDVFVLPADYNYSSFYGVDESGEQAVIRAVTTHGSREVTILVDVKSGNVNKVYEGNVAVDFSTNPFFTYDFAIGIDDNEGMGVDTNEVYVRFGKGLEQWNEIVSLQDILQEDYEELNSWVEVIELVPDLKRAIFIACTSETRQLVLWDYTKSEYTKLPEEEHKEFVLERLTVEGLSEKALALEEKYGIKVYIGEEVREAPYPDYTIIPETDMVKIRDSLDMLENTLALYPDDYFEQLKGDDVRCICFYLVGSMQPIDPSVSVSDPAGLSYLDNGLELIAISTDYGWSLTVVHELNHVLDHRLEETGILDEEKWNSFNPQGFDYYYTYVDDDGNEVEYIASTEYTAQSDEYIFDDMTDNIYFVDTYSKTFPTEDRARLMELVVIAEDDFVSDFLKSEHVREKLSYYYGLIDEYFDTSSWGTTAWERTLERAESGVEDNAA